MVSRNMSPLTWTTAFSFAAGLASSALALPARGDTTPAPHRPDQAILLEIQEKLDGQFRATRPAVQARVVAGRVVLKGEVQSYADRIQAEHTVREVDGVRNVYNRLHVVYPPTDAVACTSESSRHHSLAVRRSDTQFSVPRTDNSTASRAPAAPSPPATQLIKGSLQWAFRDTIVVRDLRHGTIEATLDHSAEVTLNGEAVSPQALEAGQPVLIVARRLEGGLVAQTVRAYAPAP